LPDSASRRKGRSGAPITAWLAASQLETRRFVSSPKPIWSAADSPA